MKALRILMAVGTLVGLVAVGTGCSGGGGGGGSAGVGIAYYPAWYNVHGQVCSSTGPGPGCNFYADGTKIRANEDAYYASSYYLESGNPWKYSDSFGNYQEFYGYAWLSADNILYDSYGRALNNQDDDSSRDAIAGMSAQETAIVQKSGKNFAGRYGLAEAKGVEIARTLNDWAIIGKKRVRTDQDLSSFTKRLFNVEADRAKLALTSALSGDTSSVEGLNDEVAAYWGTSPETSKTILKTWFKQQLVENGVK